MQLQKENIQTLWKQFIKEIEKIGMKLQKSEHDYLLYRVGKEEYFRLYNVIEGLEKEKQVEWLG